MLTQESLETSFLKGARLLLVEDGSALRQTITKILQNCGCPDHPTSQYRQASFADSQRQNSLKLNLIHNDCQE
jgi:hypothetical protein